MNGAFTSFLSLPEQDRQDVFAAAAVPGSVRLVPRPEPRAVIERDYRAVQGMILGDVPEFEWVMEQLQRAEATID